MRRERGGMRDQLRMFVLRRPDGSLAGIAPMMLTSIPARGPLRLGELQFIGADANMTEIRGPVCAPEEQLEVMTALGREVMRRSDEWNWVRWSGLQGDHRALAAALGVAMEHPAPNMYMVLQLKPTWKDFRTALPRNIKESLRKCYNAPKREGIEMDFRVIDRGPEVQTAIDRFLELHGMRASHTGGVAHPDVFPSIQARSFLHAFARAEADARRLRIFQLVVENVVVATRIGFTRGDCLYLYYSGYDPTLAKYGVMTRVVAEAIMWAIANGFAVVNLSTGRDVSKTRWRPQEVPLAEAVQIAPGMCSRLGFHATSLARKIVSRASHARRIA
jgi:CelD/BcsL family acetyltransferase involved in cellulose biosynthesis